MVLSHEGWTVLYHCGRRGVTLQACSPHKSFLTKIMFLCAVARIRYAMRRNAWFDGKIGIWPIGKWEPAKRSSKKHANGTPVWKNQCITRDVYREYLIQKCQPAVKEKWPMCNGRIRLQQDEESKTF